MKRGLHHCKTRKHTSTMMGEVSGHAVNPVAACSNDRGTVTGEMWMRACKGTTGGEHAQGNCAFAMPIPRSIVQSKCWKTHRVVRTIGSAASMIAHRMVQGGG